jgi:CBS domain containing-hemolysin-like protein
LAFLIRALKPFVWASNLVTSRFSHHAGVAGFTRKEFAAMADLGEEEGQLDPHESRVLKNLFQLRNLTVRQIMTPKPVVFAVAENLTVNEFFDQFLNKVFSRIPITRSEDDVTGFVLRADLLLAHAQGEGASPLARYKRELPAMLDVFSVLNAFNDFVERDLHIMLVVNEYGETQGLVTLEDVLETLLGLEIVDERDKFSDMQEVAKRLASLRKLKRDETNH